MLQEGGPLPVPETGLLSNTHEWFEETHVLTDVLNELFEETHVLTKQEILLGKGTRVESRRVREPRRTTLPVTRSLGFYGDGISFRVVFGQSF